MRKRLLALVFVAGALAVGPATAASAETGANTSARASASATDGSVRAAVLDRDGRVTVTTYGRYWS